MKTSMPTQKLFTRAGEKVTALGRRLRRLIRGSVRKLIGGDDAGQWIEEFNRLSGSGHSDGWRFDRNEIHQRQ
jgi:hypothetical protein